MGNKLKSEDDNCKIINKNYCNKKNNDKTLWWLFKNSELNFSETMIIFVYDTECCKDEADDPVDAVLYFHPSWVSDTQKLSLCGQLMGTTFFLKTNFFRPKIISLQNGKFVIREFGRFILAVGTDRNISDKLLEHRADLLTSLVKFYHRDIPTIFDQFKLNGQYKNLSEKLYHIFETYLPILQYNGNIFQNVPKLRLPKSASNIFLDAIQTLQSCQQTKGVLGGTLLYHNKVVATQLSEIATKNLVLTDPYRIKSTAEPIIVDFHVPIGVQMMIVYIPQHDYQKLYSYSQRAQNLITQNLSNTNSLPFQYQKRKLKRDKSLIFTNIPEEPTSITDLSTTSLNNSLIIGNINNNYNNNCNGDKNNDNFNYEIPKINKNNIQRPNHLPLRFKNVTSREIPESGFASINFDETDSFPEFIGRTSICSTPMTENKILTGNNIMSICANPTENLIIEKTTTTPPDNKLKKSLENNDNDKITPPTTTTIASPSKLKLDFDKFFSNFISNPHKIERRSSLTDIQDSLKKLSKRITLRPFAFGLGKFDVNKTATTTDDNDRNNCYTQDYIDDLDNGRKFSKTISDPTYPIFNSAGEPISKSLFQEFLEKYYSSWDENKKKDEKIAKLIEEFKEFDNDVQKLDIKMNSTTTTKPTEKFILNNINDDNLNIPIENLDKIKTPMDRKGLSLPLKPLNDIEKDQNNINTAMSSGIFDSKRKMSGIQLTPLMAKLSILALNEENKSSGFYSWDTTPGVEQAATPIDGTKLFRRRSSSIKVDDSQVEDEITDGATSMSTKEMNNEHYQKVELYVCGQQNMTMFLLLEEGASKHQELVQSMFETCVSKLTRLEGQLNQILNVNVEGDKSEGGYSFISVDPKWDTLQRGGPWSPSDLVTLEHMHNDLNMDYPITDMLIRTDDSVLYGYKSGPNEIFYKQPAPPQTGGLPPPSDVMGTIAMKAKRRLERDHSYVLF